MRAVTSIGGKDIRDLRRPLEQIPSCMEAHLVTALSQHWSWFLHVSLCTEKKTAFVKLYIQGSLLKKKKRRLLLGDLSHVLDCLVHPYINRLFGCRVASKVFCNFLKKTWRSCCQAVRNVLVGSIFTLYSLFACVQPSTTREPREFKDRLTANVLHYLTPLRSGNLLHCCVWPFGGAIAQI